MLAAPSKRLSVTKRQRRSSPLRNSRTVRTEPGMRPNLSIIALMCLFLGVISLRMWVGNAQGPSVTINIDAAANRHNINPNIYGVAFATQAQLTDLNCPLNRSGGNATSQYNWQLNADNRGNDWFFESLDDGSPIAGKINDDFIADTKAAG